MDGSEASGRLPRTESDHFPDATSDDPADNPVHGGRPGAECVQQFYRVSDHCSDHSGTIDDEPGSVNGHDQRDHRRGHDHPRWAIAVYG